MKINIGGESRAPGPTEKSALLLRIAEKHEMSQKKQDTQHVFLIREILPHKIRFLHL